MPVTNRNSTKYANLYVNKYLGDSRDYQGPIIPVPFEHTVVSGETGGASAGVRDTVNLCVIKANHQVVGLLFCAENLWVSAGVNGTLQLGDSGDDDRYMVATELYSSGGGPIPAEMAGKPQQVLAFTGFLYRPTADTIVLAEYRAANPTVGKKFRGCFLVIPPMG